MLKKIFLGLLTICFLMMTFANVNAQKKDDIKKARLLAQEGDKAYLAKNYKTAIEKYAESLVIVPNAPDVHFWKGSAHYKLDQFDSSLTEFDKALEQKFSKPFEIYRMRADIYFQKKDFPAALGDIQKGLALVPNDPNLLKIGGDIYYAQNDYQNAHDAYVKVVQFQPNNGDIEYYIAQSDFNLNKVEEQATAARSAIKKGTKFLGESFFLIGDSLQKQKKMPEALEAYQQSLISKPDQYQVYRVMAELYRGQSRFNEAIDISKKGLRQYPNDGNFYTDLSWYYSLVNRYDDAVQAALAGVRFLPKEGLGYTNLCRAYNDTKKYPLAVNACNKALTLSPNDGETYLYLGRANSFLGKEAEAAKNYDKAVAGLETFTQNNPEYSDGFYLLGNAYYADAKYGKAIDAYKQGLLMSPKFAKARYNLGLAYIVNKDKSGATEQYTALLALDKDLAAKLKAEIDKK